MLGGLGQSPSAQPLLRIEIKLAQSSGDAQKTGALPQAHTAIQHDASAVGGWEGPPPNLVRVAASGAGVHDDDDHTTTGGNVHRTEISWYLHRNTRTWPGDPRPEAFGF